MPWHYDGPGGPRTIRIAGSTFRRRDVMIIAVLSAFLALNLCGALWSVPAWLVTLVIVLLACLGIGLAVMPRAK